MANLKVFLLSFVLLFGFETVFAQEPPIITEIIALDEDVQPQDLEILEPKILPDSPFYFLKNWLRGIQSFFTFDQIEKAKLRLKFANEKLMEAKILVQKEKKPEIIKRATTIYQQEIENVRNQVEKIKEKAKENPRVESFLDKFIHQQTLHQKLLQKLEAQVSPEAFEKIKEARERHLERFQDVMLRLEDRPEKITEKLDEILEKQKGSQFKEFKNLEILKNLEEKVPEEAKTAIIKAQVKILKRLQENLKQISPADQARFKEYIERISGEKEKHLEILEDIVQPEIKEVKGVMKVAPPIALPVLEEIKEIKPRIIEKIEQKLEKIGCPVWPTPAPDFCKEGRVVIEKDPETDCPLPPKCVIPGELKILEKRHILPSPLPVKPEVREVKPPEIREVKPEVCIMLWDPVCGKDGKTYSNECFARMAGVEVAYKGMCKEDLPEKPEVPERPGIPPMSPIPLP